MRTNILQRVVELQSSMPENHIAKEKQEGIPFLSGVIKISKLCFLLSTLLHGLALYLSTYRALQLLKRYLLRMVALSNTNVAAKDRVKQETCNKLIT